MLKKKQAYTVAVLGATGAVGKESLELSEERNFPDRHVAALFVETFGRRGAHVSGQEYQVEELTEASSFAGVDIAFISATDAISRDYGGAIGCGWYRGHR